MRLKLLGAVGALSILIAAPAAAQTAPAQTAPNPGGSPQMRAPAPSKAARTTAKPVREPTAGQMAARERQKKCGAEWKEAKAGGKTGGLKWPQYWSRCNARLKGNQA
jgi:predicted lipid-binding transport protein (Tim44 family)